MRSLSVLMQNLKMVLRNIVANKKRNFLTCLGIILGVSAVMGMSASFDAMRGMMNSVAERGGMGNTLVDVFVDDTIPNGFTSEHVKALESMKDIKAIGLISALSSKHSFYFNKREFKNNTIYGRSNAFYELDKAAVIVAGRGISKADVEERSTVCVMSRKLAEKIFGDAVHAVGSELTMGGISYDVVGVEDVPYDSLVRFTNSGGRYTITLPYTTIEKVYGISPRSFIAYAASNDFSVRESAYNSVREYLEGTLYLIPDVSCMCMFGAEMLRQYEAEQAAQGREQSIIAGICLLIGGIGIMNMMFVSVTERTKEIGLRKALGATPKRIQQQFMFEAMILSLTGGVVGAVIGIIISIIVSIGTNMMFNSTDPVGDFPLVFNINFEVMFVGLFFSLLVGVVFGWMPARKASLLNPIEALKL